MNNIAMLLFTLWLIASALQQLINLNFSSSHIILPLLALVAGVLLLLEKRQSLTNNLGMLFLGIWLIIIGLIRLANLSFAYSGTILPVLALLAGVLLLSESRSIKYNSGMLLLSIWLIAQGLLPLLSISFPASGMILAVLALVSGVLLLVF